MKTKLPTKSPTATTEEKREIGRPSKYRPEMCQKAIDIFSDGGSKAEVCVALGIDKGTLTIWSSDNGGIPAFSLAIKEGLLKAESWWEKKARLHLVDMPGEGRFNTALWFINMKNRFGWRDQVDHNVSGTIKITHEQALNALIGEDALLGESRVIKDIPSIEHERSPTH